jgi:hypothetical protein
VIVSWAARRGPKKFSGQSFPAAAVLRNCFWVAQALQRCGKGFGLGSRGLIAADSSTASARARYRSKIFIAGLKRLRHPKSNFFNNRLFPPWRRPFRPKTTENRLFAQLLSSTQFLYRNPQNYPPQPT